MTVAVLKSKTFLAFTLIVICHLCMCLCVSLQKRLKWISFVSGVEIFQVLGVEVSIGGSTESNVRLFEAFVTIYLSITTEALGGKTALSRKHHSEINQFEII
jgi:hypothetical protein